MLTIIFMITTFILFGCSAMDQEPMMSEPYIYGDMVFDYETMIFNTLYESDILYNTGYVNEDFIILHLSIEQETISADQINIYRELLNKLNLVSSTIHEPIGELFNYTSTQIKSTLEDNDIEVTLNDIVTFNEIKQLLMHYKEQSTMPSVKKIDYLSFILDVNLTVEELENLDFLQEEYLDLYDTQNIDIKQMSFDDLMLALETLGKTYSEDQIASLNLAYDTLALILSRNTEK